MISRSLQQGRRRAEEIRVAARTVREAGVEPHLSLTTALRRDWAASIAVDLATPNVEAILDSMLRSRRELRC